MLVTAVNRAVGYENAAHISEVVVADHSSLRGAARASGKVSAEQFESIVKPANIFGGVDWRESTTHSFRGDAEKRCK
jgi:fumarate hydratase, class II